jgi:hypothetical protein
VTEYEFEWEGRTVRILPNPKDEELILVEAEFVDAETRSVLRSVAVLTALHRLNGEAVSIQDWRLAIDEAGAMILRANFRARDFEASGGFEEIVMSAGNFGDLVLSIAKILSVEPEVHARDLSAINQFIRG